MTQAVALARSGQTDQARRQLEAIVARHPAQPDAHLALGRVLAQSGEIDPALAHFRRAAEASGGHPQVWAIYVSALRDAGRKGRARKAAQLAPVSAPVRRELLALAERKVQADGPSQTAPASALAPLVELIRKGAWPQARALADSLAARMPREPRLHNLRGVIALRQEDPEEAERHFRIALGLAPDSIDTRANLGLALVRQSRPMEAVAVLEPHADAADATVALRVNLASAYGRAGLWRQALGRLEPLLQDAPRDPDILAIRAEVLIDSGAAEEAIVALEALQDASGPAFALPDLMASALYQARGAEAAQAYLRAQPPFPPEIALRVANIEAEWGDASAAADRARAVARALPHDPRPFRQVSLFDRWAPGDPLIDTMQRAFDDGHLTASARGRMGISLAKALTDTGAEEAGFKVLVAAKAMLREEIGYSVDDDLTRFRKLAGTWDAMTIARLSASGTGSVAPIFIIGLPRSGSTLIESILSRHPEVTSLGESPVCAGIAGSIADGATEAHVRDMARRAGPFLAERSQGRARVTDKLLANFLHVGLLAAAFPRAHFVEAARDLRATCLSIFQNPLNPAGHPYSLDLDSLGRFAAGYAQLMDHWAAVLGPRLYRCSYEGLVTDPEAGARHLLDALSLPWDPACLTPQAQTRRINTMSVAQVRRSLHTRSTERWRRHAEGLAPLLDALEDGGYRPMPDGG